jgi:hypothetical protein
MAAIERFSQELRALRDAAGAPSYRQLQHLAARRHPPLRLPPATLSDWFNGRTVPNDPDVLRFLVSELERRAARRTGTMPPCRTAHFEALRRTAVADRRTTPSPPPPEAPPSPPPARHPAPGRTFLAIGVSLCAVVATAAAVVHYLVPPAADPASTALPEPRPDVRAADGRPALWHRLPGGALWYAFENISGADACPSDWFCLYANPGYNARPGWMLALQDRERRGYDMVGRYDKAVRGYVNNLDVDTALNEEIEWHGADICLRAGTRAPSLGPHDRWASSAHIFTDRYACTGRPN